MELLGKFLASVESEYRLDFVETRGVFNVRNSGRRGENKEFSITKEAVQIALSELEKNIIFFPSKYDETKWRDSSAQYFSNDTAKSLCGVQTKSFFEMINKILCWSNDKNYEEGEMPLTAENIRYAMECLEDDEKVFASMKSVVTLPSLTPAFHPVQLIYYGVPGSGKSHRIQRRLEGVPEENVVRVVFHPEYTNADFVGQILPALNESGSGIEYRFTPGPFTKILRDAYCNPEKPYYLIIEEINRGNAAAIFGDLFQLLDRIEENSETVGEKIYAAGWSQYGVRNDAVNSYIRKSASQEVSWLDAETAIRLPPNLSLLATMNTSDQNVFALDNAFQRRWDMEFVKSGLSNGEVEKLVAKQEGETIRKQMYATISAGGKKLRWLNFQEEINFQISEKGNAGGLSSTEDRRLGGWFIKAKDGKISKESFANKVLKYLWDDAFKFSRDEIFSDEIRTFEDLRTQFLGEKGFGVFKDMKFQFEDAETSDPSV